ncbi:MAG: DUF3014 domain-containing protein [Psychromonas sp.]|nr:DUF3014 domain-containing protein [Psychromonas sp.]
MQTATNRKPKSKSLISKVIIILGIVMVGSGIYLYLADSTKTKAVVSVAEPETQQKPAIEPVAIAVEESKESAAAATLAVRQTEPTVKLPSLDNSDEMALASAKQLSTQPQYPLLLVNNEIIRNFVVFVDNFARGELLTNFSPLTKPGTPFSIVKDGKKMYINTESYKRYNRYADIIASINVESAIAQYHTLKPLFNQAYTEIGYQQEAFDNKLNEAIEMALNTPVIYEPIALTAPSAMYKFADPQLEALPDAQKLLMRMGPENILKLKTKLQQIQRALQAFK